MKWLPTFSSRLLRGFILVVFVSVSTDATQNKGIIRAIRNGSTEISRDGGKHWKPAQVGAVVGANYVLRTDAGAMADIYLGDNGPVVRMDKGTTLGFEKLDVHSGGIEKVIDTQLDLRQGRIYGNVKKMAAGSKYQIKFPNGIVAVRGTEYSLSTNGLLQVVSGTAVVIYIGARNSEGQATIQAGQQVNLSSDGSVQVLAIPRDDMVYENVRMIPPPLGEEPFAVTPTACACGIPSVEPPDLKFPPLAFRRAF